jgi:two-component system response regulator NreC
MTPPPTVRVVIADDHPILRAGVRLLLEAQPDLAVVGEAGDLAATRAAAVDLAPDVLLLDIEMRGESGLRIIPEVRRDSPATRILVLTMHDDPEFLRTALALGAAGYLMKSSADTDLVDAIRRVHGGGTCLDPHLTGAPLAPPPPRSPRARASSPGTLESLSARERQVLEAVAYGHTNQEIADQLGIGMKSVATYRARLSAKLGLRSRVELVRFALEHGLILTRREPPGGEGGA